jgi:outer membrane protein OmpA-like peptidoglycan-associated protein
MKSILIRIALCAVASAISLPIFAQRNYYVVVSAFSTEGDVKEFTTHLPVFNPDTIYAMSDQGNTLHLFVLKTASEDVAVSKAMQIQNNLESTIPEVQGSYESISLSNSLEGKKMEHENKSSDKSIAKISNDLISVSSISNGQSNEDMKPKGTLFKFMITNEEGIALPGSIHNVDFVKEMDLGVYESNTYTDLLKPSRNTEMSLTCGIFGYKFTEKQIDYTNPSSLEDSYQDEKGAWVIPYKLERLEKGDVSVMYNVSFHKDAVIMTPQSKTDLDELVRMMQENPNYEITIHGHCNGKNSRKIIAMGAEQQFFDINGSQEIYESAKVLSDLRNRAVKLYLIENGIDGKRIKTYAWGGSLMLVGKDSPHAKLNDRIEIEIRKN